ncbi:MAG: hypothetical protein RBR59_02890 [Sulfurimonadaceae bacterium]|jgi:queuine/archaeosine tRNA-ribosyltransferase|nr:hypothetical protein [Sulfurimonadaceae bacterium]
MSYIKKLQELITMDVIPDIDERLDEIFEEITDKKNADAATKEEIEDLQEFKADLKDLLNDIIQGDVEEDEAKEIYEDILEAQNEDDEDFEEE